jgi:glutamine synthetase
MMMAFDRKNNAPKFDFSGGELCQGETDGSSFPNGGLRATHTAGGYLCVDTSSNIFLRGDTVFIPATFVSYHGDALDEKVPLLRACECMSAEAKKLLGLMNYKIDGLVSNIGLEQELFLIPREAYLKRPDLQMAGRTVIGADAPRGQELSDHYMAPLSSVTPAFACMKEIQTECWKMGIPLKTRHREVAPNQFEFAPLYGTVTTQIDQNIMVMQVIEEVAVRHGLAALHQEKPFNNINGSGKHNNWSLGTTDGVNLLNPKQLNAASGNHLIFPVIMAAIVAGIDEHGDLMRMSIASPGNDFRLGAMEAPPAIISTYLGEAVTTYLENFKSGKDRSVYKPTKKTVNIGTSCVQPFEVPSEDRNRTSPFPYGGHRFEFRAVGSSQNVSMVNTVLNMMCAEKFAEFSAAIEGGASPEDVASAALDKAWKVIFNGDNYDVKNQDMLTERGVWRIDSGVEAMHAIVSEKNKAVFEKMKVLSPHEVDARETVMFEHYVGTVEIELLALCEMLRKNVIPDIKKSEGVSGVEECKAAIVTLKDALKGIHAGVTPYEQAKLARVCRLETMITIRTTVDAIEEEVPAENWSLATYSELLFLDQNQSSNSTININSL